MHNLSPTKINKYYTCPYSFYCEYIARKQQIKTPDAALFGQMVHNIIVTYYDKIDNNTSIDDAMKKIEEAFVEGTDYRLFEGYKQDAKKVQESLKKWESERIKSKVAKPILIEKALKAELFPELPPIEGRIDFYLNDTQTWGDWKTGHYEEMTPERQVQGKVYELLLIANGYPVNGGVFVNLASGSIQKFPKVTSSWLENRIHTMVNKIEKGVFPPNKSPLCDGWCGYRLSCDLLNSCPWKDLV